MRYKCSVSLEKSNPFSFPSINSVDLLLEISINAFAQKRVTDAIQVAEKKIYEFEQIYNIISDAQICNNMY